MSELHEICDAAYNDVADVAKEVRKKGSLISSGMLEAADKLAHTIKSIETVNAMHDAGYHNDGYGSRYYDDGYSRRGGYARYNDDGYNARRRDSMGRYRDTGEDVKEKLREAMNMAPDEQSREAIRKAMEKV